MRDGNMVTMLSPRSPKIYESPASVSATSLFANLLMDDLKEYAYDAEMAGIEYKISHDVYAMKVREQQGGVKGQGSRG